MTGVIKSTEKELNEALKGSPRRGSGLYDPEALMIDDGVCEREGAALCDENPLCELYSSEGRKCER